MFSATPENCMRYNFSKSKMLESAWIFDRGKIDVRLLYELIAKDIVAST